MPGGRPALPAEVKKRKGTFRKDREPQNPAAVRAKLPDPPEWLGEFAKNEWIRRGTMLEAAGLIADLDEALFASYCIAYQQLHEATVDIEEHGMYVVRLTSTKIEQSIPNPSIKMRDDAAKRLETLGARFGMEPAARGKIEANPPSTDDEDEMAEFLQPDEVVN